jgi:hypothetical protein
MRKYGQNYEDSINPFIEFGKRERERGYKVRTRKERKTPNVSRMFP